LRQVVATMAHTTRDTGKVARGTTNALLGALSKHSAHSGCASSRAGACTCVSMVRAKHEKRPINPKKAAQ
jgi:hypothetical protein